MSVARVIVTDMLQVTVYARPANSLPHSSLHAVKALVTYMKIHRYSPAKTLQDDKANSSLVECVSHQPLGNS